MYKKVVYREVLNFGSRVLQIRIKISSSSLTYLLYDREHYRVYDILSVCNAIPWKVLLHISYDHYVADQKTGRTWVNLTLFNRVAKDIYVALRNHFLDFWKDK